MGNFPKYIGMQLVDCGRAWAVDLRLEEAPEAEVEGGARSVPYSQKFNLSSKIVNCKV